MTASRPLPALYPPDTIATATPTLIWKAAAENGPDYTGLESEPVRVPDGRLVRYRIWFDPEDCSWSSWWKDQGRSDWIAVSLTLGEAVAECVQHRRVLIPTEHVSVANPHQAAQRVVAAFLKQQAANGALPDTPPDNSGVSQNVSCRDDCPTGIHDHFGWRFQRFQQPAG